MAVAPDWGADCGGLTPGPVFPATSSCVMRFTELCGDWAQGADGNGRAGKLIRERGLSQLCLDMRMPSGFSCILQELPILSFFTLNRLGSVVTLISEQPWKQ